MRVLFLSPRESWPATSGARLRDLHFARTLAQRSELTYIYFSPDPARSEMALHVPDARTVLPVRAPDRYTFKKILLSAVTSQPLPVQNYTTAPMHAAIEASLRTQSFDFVHLDSIHLAGYLPLIRKLNPEARTVLDWHNIESELMRRYAVRATSWPRRLYARRTANSLKHLEFEMLTTCFGHLVCSQREYRELHGLRPQTRVAVIENGVDTARFQVEASKAAARSQLIFVGQMSYHANVEGICWFVRDIWPAIRKRYPHVELTIVGSDPAPAILALGSGEHIRVTGTVPDVAPFYENALAAIVPLRTGGGTRLKILEAMAAGVPVLSTSLGAEGLNVTDGSNILLVGGGVGSWLAAIDIAQGMRRAELVQNGRQLVAAEYDWNVIGNRLAALFQEWQRSD